MRQSPRDEYPDTTGLGATRAMKIHALARAVAANGGGFHSLRHLSDKELESKLIELPGIGFKTARVVAAMSSFERDRFAVDTHIWRISRRLGWYASPWTSEKPTKRQADELETLIPAKGRRQLHACLVELGRKRCGTRSPDCLSCVLNDICPTAQRQAVEKRRR